MMTTHKRPGFLADRELGVVWAVSLPRMGTREIYAAAQKTLSYLLQSKVCELASPGADARSKAFAMTASVMRRIVYRLSAAWLLGVFLAAPQMARTQDTDMDTGMSSGTSPTLCLDGMETVPEEDDLVPTEISVDGGCMVPQTPISV
ncbi:MAG TPA: hypothetical protein VGG66_07625 [Rhizomicrobium sp.]|jgi:hypothetical protein